MKKVYQFHADPAHGWVAVKLTELKRLGIATQISKFSFMKGNIVYLEEDCDATIFIKEKQRRGEEYSIKETHTDNSHRIRGYPRYIPA